MVSVKDGERLVLIHADEQHRTQIIVWLVKPVTYHGELRSERPGVPLLMLAHLLSYFDYRKTFRCKIPPLSSRKYANLFKIGLLHLDFKPFRVRGEFSPQGEVSNE
jgi:hypothetical protein